MHKLFIVVSFLLIRTVFWGQTSNDGPIAIIKQNTMDTIIIDIPDFNECFQKEHYFIFRLTEDSSCLALKYPYHSLELIPFRNLNTDTLKPKLQSLPDEVSNTLLNLKFQMLKNNCAEIFIRGIVTFDSKGDYTINWSNYE